LAIPKGLNLLVQGWPIPRGLPWEISPSNGVAVVADKFHFKGYAVAMHQNGGAYVASRQPLFGQITRQKSHGIQFFDCAHSFGNGCAVTKRGTPPLMLVTHALRGSKGEPQGGRI
jgi:hypothetical protein